MSVFSIVPVFRDFGMPGDDDIAGTGNLVAAFDLAFDRFNYLFYL